MKLFSSNSHDITPEDIFLDQDDTSALYVESPDNRFVLVIALVLSLGVLGLLWGRAYQLQVAGQDASISELLGRPGEEYIIPPRGNIYDRNGELLAYNEASFEVRIYPEQLPEDITSKAQVLDQAAALFELDRAELETVASSQESEILIAREVPTDRARLFQIEGDSLQGIELVENRIRTYPDPFYFSHLIGYTGKLSDRDLEENPRYLRSDQIGKVGIERQYEQLLKGEYGLKTQVGEEVQTVRSAQAGTHIQLTIDAELQKVLQDSMQRVLDTRDLDRATGIVMNPQTGEVLAMSSLPTFDNNSFIGGISQQEYQALLDNPANPLLNRAVSGEFAPASTVKPLLAGAFLQEGIVSTQDLINDPDGRLIVPNRFNPDQPTIFPDWKIHGTSDFYKAIADSVNVYFYTFGGGAEGRTGLGIDGIANWYRKFGFGAPTGIDLPTERSGIVADPDWKQTTFGEQWLLGDTYNVSIGQGGMAATPIQVLNATNVIANGGDLYRPHLFRATYDSEERFALDTKSPERLREDILAPEVVTEVQRGMRQTVTDGTGYLLQELSFNTAAKTGTAQTGAELNNSWFTAYGPIENPQISIVVLIEKGDEGFLTSIPVAKEVLDWYDKNRGFE